MLNAIKAVWDSIWNTIKTTVSNIWNNVKDTISNVINIVKDNISNVLNNIKSIWDNIWNNLKNTVIDIFNGIWNGIKGVINSILGGIEKMANGVINGINGMIRALNRLHFDIPDWVPGLGGKGFGINIPTLSTVSLPRLAQGGYVKANTPRLAVIGDNKTQGEVVAPEGKIIENVIKALKLYEGDNSSNNGDIIIPVYIDSSLAFREIRKREDRLSLATNGRRS